MRFAFTSILALVLALAAVPVLSAPATESKPKPKAVEASCQKVFDLCITTARNLTEAKWRAAPFGVSKECTLAATCYADTPDLFLTSAYAALFPNGTAGPPKSADVARLPQNVSLFARLQLFGPSHRYLSCTT
jgi:hypothetical protein